MPFNLNLNSIFLALLGPGKPPKRAKEDSGLQKLLKREQIVVQIKNSSTLLMVCVYLAPAMPIYLQKFNNKIYEKCSYSSHCICFLPENHEGFFSSFL